MAKSDPVRVMISSRSEQDVSLDGGKTRLASLRKTLRDKIEEELLFGEDLFAVWIHEDAASPPMTLSAWEESMKEVRRADIVLVLYTGDAGWAAEGQAIGICHAEISEAYDRFPAKVRVLQVGSKLAPLGSGKTRTRNQAFRDYMKTLAGFYAPVESEADLLATAKATLRQALDELVRLGGLEATRGSGPVGSTLRWDLLDFKSRQGAMATAARAALLNQPGSTELGDEVVVDFAHRRVLMLCHAIPASLSIASAREMVGQPFLQDHLHADQLKASSVTGGPVHVIACHKGVTESQAMRILGFPDATIVRGPFGVYVADDVQKIQLVFLRDCRNPTQTYHAVQRLIDWLAQSGEADRMGGRAESRLRIVATIAGEASDH